MATLEGQIAVITGASRGIGRCIAVRLAGLKAMVVLCARSEDLLNGVARQIEHSGGRSLVIPVELEEERSIKALAATVRDRFGRLDILVNNAGITHSAVLEATATEDYDRLMHVNARAPFILCRETLDMLKNSPAGRIVNICSVVGIKGYPKQIAYTASKHALRGMSIALAEELRGTRVRVHVICPGGVDTDMVGQVRPDINKGELIGPDEVAELVEYMVTHQGNAVVDELRIRRATAGPWF